MKFYIYNKYIHTSLINYGSLINTNTNVQNRVQLSSNIFKIFFGSYFVYNCKYNVI